MDENENRTELNETTVTGSISPQDQETDPISENLKPVDSTASPAEENSAPADIAMPQVSEDSAPADQPVNAGPEPEITSQTSFIAEKLNKPEDNFSQQYRSGNFYVPNQNQYYQTQYQNDPYRQNQQYAGGTQQYGQNQQYANTYGRPELVQKKKKQKKFSPAALIAACIILSLLCGFGGAYAYGRFFGSSSSGSTVIYQTVPGDSMPDITNTSDITNLQGIIAKASSSVVEITTESVTTNPFLGEYVTTGAGSGVIISEDGYIVTCAHVVSDSNKVNVKLPDGREYVATIIGVDSRKDTAVIKIDENGLTPAVLGSSSSLVIGDTAIAIGNPLQLGGTVTQGIISSLSRTVTVNRQTMTLLQTDAAVNPGNSGGGLFNSRGELVGIVNAKAAEEGVDGLGFAIPIDDIKSEIESLITSGYVTGRPGLGITAVTVTTTDEAQQLGVSRLGVYVYTIMEGGGAEKAGLQPGDYIVSVDDTAVSTVDDIQLVLEKHEIGDTVTLQIIRDNQMMTFEVELGELKSVPVQG